jgi:hypothetical protein
VPDQGAQGSFPGRREGLGSCTDEGPATAMEGGAGASAGRRPELFAMDGALVGERVKFTADFTQDFTARP